jgi:hypothetical protein
MVLCEATAVMRERERDKIGKITQIVHYRITKNLGYFFRERSINNGKAKTRFTYS